MTVREQISNLYKQLSSTEQKQVLMDLPKLGKKEATVKEISIINVCPYCKQTDIFKDGTPKGIQRYKCKSCNRNFSSTTGKAFSGIKKKDKFIEYKSIIIKEGLLPLKQMSLRLGISIQTSFDWRHKILSSLSTENKDFEGITEMDDLWFL
jgi:transposase-like protein